MSSDDAPKGVEPSRTTYGPSNIVEVYELSISAIPGAPWIEVSKSDWIKAERQAGFRPPLPSSDPDYATTCATGGFTGAGVKGRISYR